MSMKTKTENGRKDPPRRVSPEILDRVPPCDITAEQSVLGSLMLHPPLLDDVGPVVKASDFYDQSHAAVYGTMVGLYERGGKIDLELLVIALKKSGDFERVGGAAALARI